MRTLLLALCCVTGLTAQSQIAFEDTPSAVRVGQSVSLGAYLQAANGLRSASGLAYSADSPQIVSIGEDGQVTGLFPGEAAVTVTDLASQTSATWTLIVMPARILITPSTVELTVGESISLTARALDVQGREIAGLTFTYSSSMAQLVRMDGAKLTALAIGQTFVTARLDGLTSGSGTFATLGVRINPKPLYSMRPLISSAAVTSASPISYSKVVSSNNRTAVLASFDNGGQAAVLIESGQPKVLMAAGQSTGENGMMVLRLMGISLNRQGDVAVLADMGEYWCSSTIFLFPRQGPMVELPLGCSGWLGSKSLAHDGSMIYYQDNVPQGIVKRSPAGEVTSLLQKGATVAGLGVVRDFQSMTPNSDGTLMIQISPPSGTNFYAVYDGTKWAKAFTTGDLIDGLFVNQIDGIVPNGAGLWYFRASGNGFGVIASVDATGRRRAVLRQQEPVDSTTRLGWPHRVVDADGANLLLMASIGIEEKYDNYMAWVKPGNQIQTIVKSHWDALLDGSATANGPIAGMVSDGVVKLQRTGSAPDVLMSPTVKLAVPPGAQWRNMRIGSRDGWAQGAEDGFFRPSDNRSTFLPGQKLPSQQALIGVDSSSTHPGGWTVFTALSQNGQGVYLSGNGRVTQLVDTGSNTTDASGRPIQWVERQNQNMRLAVNSKGDAVFGAGVNGNWSLFLHKQGEPLPRPVFGPSTVLPGNSFVAWASQSDVDDAGNVRFFTGISGGGNGIYQVSGSTVKTLMSTKELFEGAAVRSLYNFCSRNGFGLAVFDRGNSSGNSFALNAGGAFTSVEFGAPDRGGVALTSMPGNACDASPAGDLFLVGQTSDGRTGIFHYSQVTRKLRAVTLAGQKLTDGATLIQPFQVSAGPNGTFFFSAHVYRQGANSLAVYEAVPQP